MEKTDLTGKKALITGADGGIGRAIALRLAECGMKLALVGRNAEALVRTAALTGRPLDMLVLPVDLEKPRAMEDIMRIMTGHFKMLDLLVNCSDIVETDFDIAKDINVKAPLLLCQKALPLLRLSECPTIVNIGVAMSGQGITHSALTDALRGMTKALESLRTHMILADLPLQDASIPNEIAEIVTFLVEHRGKGIIDEIRVHG